LRRIADASARGDGAAGAPVRAQVAGRLGAIDQRIEAVVGARQMPSTGVQATHLRHGIYAAVIAGEVDGAVAAGELAAPVADATVAPVLRQDLAAGIATALLGKAHGR
jgi:hypothetical protein